MKRFLVQFGAAKTELASVLLFTFPGTPMLYSGEEQGEAVAFPRILKKDAFSPWFQFYQQLIGLRQKNLAFREGTYQRIQNDVQEKIFSFLRFQGDQEFLIALNFSKKPVATTLLLEKSRYPDLDNTNATWKQVLPKTEEKWPFTATPKLKLDGFGYKVLELVRK
jgi:glycosidase